jgi:hypothetical protein
VSRSPASGSSFTAPSSVALTTLAAALALALAPRPAAAQSITGFALDRFEPAGAGSGWASLESLDFEGHLRPSFAAATDWAYKPLVFYDSGGHELAALVRQQAVLHLGAAVTLWERARVDVSLPIGLVASGGDVQILAQRYGGPEGAGLGDLRLGADVRVLGGAHDLWRLGVGAQLFVPTGGTRQFTSDGAVRFWPRLMAAGEHGRLTWAARLGLHLRPSDACACDLAPGSEVTFGAAVGWQAVRRLVLGAELTGSAALSSASSFSRAAAPVELLLEGHVEVAPRWRVTAGVGPGLSDGPGSPAVRGLVGVSYDLAPASPSLASQPPAWGAPVGP